MERGSSTSVAEESVKQLLSDIGVIFRRFRLLSERPLGAVCWDTMVGTTGSPETYDSSFPRNPYHDPSSFVSSSTPSKSGYQAGG